MKIDKEMKLERQRSLLRQSSIVKAVSEIDFDFESSESRSESQIAEVD